MRENEPDVLRLPGYRVCVAGKKSISIARAQSYECSASGEPEARMSSLAKRRPAWELQYLLLVDAITWLTYPNIEALSRRGPGLRRHKLSAAEGAAAGHPRGPRCYPENRLKSALLQIILLCKVQFSSRT